MFAQTIFFAFCIAVVSSLPWTGTRRVWGVVLAFLINTLLATWVVFLALPNTAGPLYGDVGVITLWFLIANGGVAFAFSAFIEEEVGVRRWPIGAGVLAVLTGILMSMLFSTNFNALRYSKLVGEVEERQWSSDFQPKDPKHFRVSSQENAEMLSGRAIGQGTTMNANGQPNSIGSQFQVNSGVSSIQLIEHNQWTVVPIDWKGWGPQWDSRTPGIPGYIKVSGENPIVPVEFVRLSHGKELQYTPAALWGKNLDRLVWYYHPDKIIADKHLEIDDENTPYYIVSIALPTIGWWGERVVGALIIDPVTGAGAEKLIPLGEVPHWVDRVEALHLVHRNIDYHGKYAGGWMNRSIYGNSVLAATETHFGYGSNGEPVFQTGITAHTNTGGDSVRPDSLVAVYYTNTRTGKTTEYMLQGGATEQTAIDQCNLLGDVKNKSYHGTTPQLYNVYGRISYVVPLQNASHGFAGVCIVSVMNVQVIAWGPSAHEADLAFKQVIVNGNSQIAIEGTSNLSKITGQVVRKEDQIINGSTSYSVLLKGVPHLFTIPASASDVIVVTQPGDQVEIEYYNSGERVMPVWKFNNLSLVLQASVGQSAVEEKATKDLDTAYMPSDDKKIDGALGRLSPEDRKLIERHMNKYVSQ